MNSLFGDGARGSLADAGIFTAAAVSWDRLRLLLSIQTSCTAGEGSSSTRCVVVAVDSLLNCRRRTSVQRLWNAASVTPVMNSPGPPCRCSQSPMPVQLLCSPSQVWIFTTVVGRLAQTRRLPPNRFDAVLWPPPRLGCSSWLPQRLPSTGLSTALDCRRRGLVAVVESALLVVDAAPNSLTPASIPVVADSGAVLRCCRVDGWSLRLRAPQFSYFRSTSAKVEV